jgi:hypothetical protein
LYSLSKPLTFFGFTFPGEFGSLRITMSEEHITNGTTSPVTPKMSGLALTEYTAAPTPPSERAERITGLPPNWGIPNAFLLPNGYPDVRNSLNYSG